MMPYILEIGPLRVPSYGFMLMIAFMTNYFLLTRETKKLGKDPEIAGDLIFWAAIGGIGGSKVYYMICGVIGWQKTCFKKSFAQKAGII